MRTPKLSIGLPVYNGEKYLAGTLDSLLGQDFKDFELIISDNGSTDQTASICQAYARRDSRIRYFRNESNRGATWNFRRVFELAEGEYFKWATYDDECYPQMLRRCMEVMEQADDSVALVYPRSEFIDEIGAVAKREDSPAWDRVCTAARRPHQRLAHVLMRARFGQAFYGIIRISFLRQTRPFGNIAADWVKLAELAMLGTIVEVPEILFRLRLHPMNAAVAATNWRNLLLWHDPSLQGRTPLLPKSWAFVLEYLKSIHHLPLTRTQKILCCLTALLTPPWRAIWIPTLRISGPARIRLRKVTGWSWLSRGSGAL